MLVLIRFLFIPYLMQDLLVAGLLLYAQILLLMQVIFECMQTIVLDRLVLVLLLKLTVELIQLLEHVHHTTDVHGVVMNVHLGIEPITILVPIMRVVLGKLLLVLV